MKIALILILALASLAPALASLAPVPSTVVIPPTTIYRRMLFFIPDVERPSNKDEMTNLMLAYPKEAFEGMHEYDMEVCQDNANPVNPLLVPSVLRCTGVI